MNNHLWLNALPSRPTGSAKSRGLVGSPACKAPVSSSPPCWDGGSDPTLWNQEGSLDNWNDLTVILVFLKNAPSQPKSSTVSSCRNPKASLFFILSLFLLVQASIVCWYNPISVPGFGWSAWFTSIVTSLSNDCLATSLVLYSEHTFTFFVVWINWEFSNSSSSGSFLLKNFFNLSLSSHIITISSKEKQGYIFNSLLRNLS